MKSNALTKGSLNKDFDCLWYRIANNMMQSDTTALTQTTILNTQKTTPQTTPETQEITSNWYRTIQEMPDIWSVLDIEDAFLSKAYLEMLEKYTPDGMRFIYWVFFKDQRPIGFLYGQLQRFNPYDSLAPLQVGVEGTWWKKTKHRTKQLFAKNINSNILFVGNLLVTGEHGFYFNENDIKKINLVQLLENTIKETLPKIGEKRVGAIFFKEYFEEKTVLFDELKERNYHLVPTEPNMIVHIRPEWKKFDDYLQAMSSKYRVRAKRAFKKSKEIEKREFSLADIDQHNERIFGLYKETASNADFNTLFLNERYFYGLKELLKDDFKLIGYFLEGELIGYYTLIYGTHEIDAHFLGIDGRFNSKHQVYLNMLYDMIRAGIDGGKQQIIMARTAMEIKSSVGAVAHEMSSYIKVKNSIYNRYFPRYSDSFLSPSEWTPRQPFKDKK